MMRDVDTSFYQRGGVKRSFTADVMRRVPINQLLNTTELVSFTHPVVLLFETSTVKNLLLDGEVIRSDSTFNDFYGFMTSPREHLADAERLRKSGPCIEQQIVMTLESRYAHLLKDAPEVMGSAKYQALPPDWMICDGEGFNTAEAIVAYAALPFPDNIDIRPRFGGEHCTREFLLWSSRDDLLGNRARYAAALEGVDFFTTDEIAEQLSRWDENVVPA